MLLYRGDNRLEAKYYRSEGMLSRLANGRNPATVEHAGLWEVSRAHVLAEGANEEAWKRATPFLSFSEDRGRAEQYAIGRRAGSLRPCDPEYGEDAIVFELETEGMEQDGQEGVYVLHFPCDYTRVAPIDQEAADLAKLGVPQLSSCEYCAVDNIRPDDVQIEGGRFLHRIQLIRVATFLRNYPDRQRYEGAMACAQRDREWLVYPMDYVHRLRGYSSRIPPARVWNAFRYTFVPAEGRAPALY
jgi:hypothetical protein